MKCQAALLYGPGQSFVMDEITIDEPKTGEVLIKVAATGLCHSDHHLVTGVHGALRFPMLGGHEAAGTVVKVGPGVSRLEEGDHVLTSFIPVCGHCRWCSTGHSPICDNGAIIMSGHLLDGTFRMHDSKGEDVGQFCVNGTFAEYTVIPEISAVKIDPIFDMSKVCIVSCAVPTGIGAATNAADVQAGDSVAVFGVGGIGNFALQGSVLRGAEKIIAIDPVPFKRDMAKKLGATHVIDPTKENPVECIKEITWGVGVDKAMVAIARPTPDDVGRAFDSIRKGGRAVLIGIMHIDYNHVSINARDMVLSSKQLVGTLYGDSNIDADLTRYLELYRAGKIKIDEIVTQTYKLDDINQAMTDMLENKNMRGVIVID